MNTTLKPQSVNRKTKIITIFLGMFIILTSGWLHTSIRYGAEVIAPALMFLFALCLIFFAIWSEKNWWAIIPAGFFASLGGVVALDILVPHEAYPSLPGTLNWGFYTCVLFLGLATTFGVLWLLRKILPTSWAIYPAAGFLALAVLFIIEGAHFSEYWLETTLLVFGVTFLLAVLARKKQPVS